MKSRTIAFFSPFMVQVNGPRCWIQKQIRGYRRDGPFGQGLFTYAGVGYNKEWGMGDAEDVGAVNWVLRLRSQCLVAGRS